MIISPRCASFRQKLSVLEIIAIGNYSKLLNLEGAKNGLTLSGKLACLNRSMTPLKAFMALEQNGKLVSYPKPNRQLVDYLGK